METIQDKRLGVEYETGVKFSALEVGDILWTPFGYKSVVVYVRVHGTLTTIGEVVEECSNPAGVGEYVCISHDSFSMTSRFRRRLTSEERGLLVA